MMLMVNSTVDANFTFGKRLLEIEKRERFRLYFGRVTCPSTCVAIASLASQVDRMAVQMIPFIPKAIWAARFCVLATTVMKTTIT